VVRLTNNVADSGAVQKPVSLLTDDELEQRLAQKIALAADAQRNLSYLQGAGEQVASEVEIPGNLANLTSHELEQAMSMARLAQPPCE
jgi:hypothetical protein